MGKVFNPVMAKTAIGQIFIAVNGQILKNNLAIWSLCWPFAETKSSDKKSSPMFWLGHTSCKKRTRQVALPRDSKILKMLWPYETSKPLRHLNSYLLWLGKQINYIFNFFPLSESFEVLILTTKRIPSKKILLKWDIFFLPIIG